jgi:hypothetical protein
LYGLENFEYFVIAFVTDKELLIKEEQKYMDMVPSNLRYNFCPTAGSCLGVVRSAETKAAISAARLGATHSVETKAALRESIKGNTNRALCVYVYDENNVLVGSFPSHTAAGAFLDVHPTNVSRLINTGRRNRKGFLIYSAPLT